MWHKLISLWLLVLVSTQSQASIDEDLKNFFNKAGMQSNINSPGNYQDQSAGYYTGGSLVARSQPRVAQLATIQMPGFRAGCGGIDAWTGGFSHINAKGLTQMLQSIGSSAASYAFLLSIQTVSPQIYNILNELNAIATKVNNLNISSCETAATMLGGVWPKTDQSSKHLCQAMGSELGEFSDWAAARQGCGAKGDRGKVLARKESNAAYKDILAGEFNLSWLALQKNAFLSADQKLSELFMTLVGSIISKKEGNNYQIKVLSAHADKDDVIKGLLNGGETPIYHCDNEKCLNPRLDNITVDPNSALVHRVRNTLEAMVQKIYQDEAITDSEKGFLNATRLPIYKMLNVLTAYRGGAAPLNLHDYVDLIALDILYKYVLEVIDVVHDSVVELKSVQVDEEHIKQFLGQLSEARARIHDRQHNAFLQMDSVLSMIQATQLVEKQLHMMLGGVANEHNWY
jgi:conjugative transfer pilus assembly protein TraH